MIALVVDNDEKRAKQMYQSPETKEEALRLIKSLSTRLFAKLKGRGLTIIESWWDKEDSRLEPAKSLYNTMIADVCNQTNKEVLDVLRVLVKE
jgi:hypothetical protein